MPNEPRTALQRGGQQRRVANRSETTSLGYRRGRSRGAREFRGIRVCRCFAMDDKLLMCHKPQKVSLAVATFIHRRYEPSAERASSGLDGEVAVRLTPHYRDSKERTLVPEMKRSYPGIIKLQNGRYKVRYRLLNGEQRAKTFDTVRQARDFQADIRKGKRTGEISDPRQGRMSFAEYAHTKWYPIKDDVEPNALSNIRTRLGLDADGNYRKGGYYKGGHYQALNDLPIASIRYEDILAWRAEFSKRASNETVNGSLGTLRQIFRLAKRSGAIGVDPTDGVSELPQSPGREIHPATPSQVHLLAEALPERFRRAVLVCALGTGLRAGELWAMREDRINFELRTLRVDQSLQEHAGQLVTSWPKGRKTRTIRLDVETLRLLEEQIDEFPSPEGWVFTAPEGGPVGHANFKKRHYSPAVDALGERLPRGFTFHDLRHTHASLCIAKGARPDQVRDRLGHGSIRTTYDTYGHLFPGHDDALLDDLAAIVRDAEDGVVVPLNRRSQKKPGELKRQGRKSL